MMRELSLGFAACAAKFSEADGKVAVAGYEKYRQFIDDALWTEVKMAK